MNLTRKSAVKRSCAWCEHPEALTMDRLAKFIFKGGQHCGHLIMECPRCHGEAHMDDALIKRIMQS